MLVPVMTPFAEWLDSVMKRRRPPLNQSQIATYLGMKPSGVNAWFTRGARPSYDNCAKLARFLKLSPESVLRAAGYDVESAAESDEGIVPELASRIAGLSEADQGWLLQALDGVLLMREQTARYDAAPPAEEPPGE